MKNEPEGVSLTIQKVTHRIIEVSIGSDLTKEKGRAYEKRYHSYLPVVLEILSCLTSHVNP